MTAKRRNISSWQMIRIILNRPGYKLLWLKVWVVVLFLFLWVPRINLLAYIFTQAPISFVDKITYVFKDFATQLASITNPVILSMFIFSILTAFSIVLLIFMVRTGRLMNSETRTNRRVHAGVAIAAIGSHILSCGGTLLLAPIIPALAGSSTILGGPGVTINLWLATTANLAGITLVLIAINRTCKHTIKMLLA